MEEKLLSNLRKKGAFRGGSELHDSGQYVRRESYILENIKACRN
jgi:hypothetical protein